MSAWQAILLDSALKSGLLLMLAWLAVGFMRKTSAAARHLVWFLAVAALPWLPVLSWTLPGWHVLPGWLDAKPLAREVLPQHEKNYVAPQPAGAPEMAEAAPPVAEPRPRVAPAEVSPAGGPVPAPEPPKLQKQRVAAAMNYWRWTLVAWLGVAFVVLSPAALGMLSLWRLEWGARREHEPGWLQLLQRLVERLDIRRRVHLLKSGRRRMPMTWGVLRPRLLLPEESREWPEERRRVVMLHELAHAKRLDYLTNLVTQLACAMYWINPLVWLAARRMAVERERACDDIVLNHGAKPADYAEQVLQIAAGLPVARFDALGGIPMARRSGLEGRLRAILDGTRNRSALSRLVLLAMLAALAVVVVPVAMLKAATAAADNSPQTEVVFWQMLVNQAAVDELFPGSSFATQTNGYAWKMLDGTNWMETVRKADRDGGVHAAPSAVWLEPQARFRGQSILQRIDSPPGWDKSAAGPPMVTVMVNGFYAFVPGGEEARLDLSYFDLTASYAYSEPGSRGFVFYHGEAHSPKPMKWRGRIGTGQALVYVERFSGNLPTKLYHLAIFQAVNSPAALAADLRGMTSATRWLAGGPAGTLDEIQAARTWEERATTSAAGGEMNWPAFPAPLGAPIRIVAIGQPARWPLRWWNADAAGVKSNPHWQEAAGNAAFLVAISGSNGDGLLDCSLRLPDNPPPGISLGSANSQQFAPADFALTLTELATNRPGLAQYFDRGGRVDLVVKHGVGDWQEIGKIHEDESNNADGGHFALAKLQKQGGTKSVLIDAHFDYDPGFEIAFAAVDKRGKRSPVPQSFGSGNFEQRADRRIYTFTEIGRELDHFAILKRPVKEYVFTNLPTAPRLPVTNPMAMNEPVSRETAAAPIVATALVAMLPAGAPDSGLTARLPSAATNSAASTNRLEFQPEVEKVLDTHGALGVRAYLSFDTGTVSEESSAENPQRNRQLHRDLVLRTIEGEQEWTGVDLEVAPATEEMWDTPPDQLVAALADNLAPPLPTMQVTPGVWFFKTRDGIFGLLRVVGFVEPRPGYKAMRVVYKLATPARAQKQASGPPGGGKISIEAVDAQGNYPNSPDSQALVVSLQGQKAVVPVKQSGPGVELPAGEAGTSGTYVAYGQGSSATHGLAGDWGEPADGLRSRLVAGTNVFRAGQPIMMRIEIQNVGGQTRYFHNPTAPYFGDLQVFNAGALPIVIANSPNPFFDVPQAIKDGVKEVPFIGGPIQLAGRETNLNADASAVFEPFDLSRFYYLHAPGKYTVKWKGLKEGPQPLGAPDPGHAFSDLPSSAELRFVVAAPPGVPDDGDPVGRLLPLLGSTGWLDDAATNSAAVGTTSEAEPWGPLWHEGEHYQKSAELRPGGNWTKVPGYGFIVHRDHHSYRRTTTNYDATIVWLWLTDTAAEREPALRDGLPGSDYLGETSRWHVYVSMDANASNTWPTAKEDLKRALGGEPPAPQAKVSVERGHGSISIETTDAQGNYDSSLKVNQVTVASTNGEKVTVPLKQTAPGYYEGAFPAGWDGTNTGNRPVTPATNGTAVAQDSPRTPTSTNHPSWYLQFQEEVPGVITERQASLDLPMRERLNQFVAGAPRPNTSGEAWSPPHTNVITLVSPTASTNAEVIHIPMPVPAHNSPGSRDGLVYDLRAADCFYLEWGGGMSVFGTVYGPFRGDPVKILGLLSDWGEATDGVSVGLAAPKILWNSGETPELVARVRNQWITARGATNQELAELEVDGIWYNWKYPYSIMDAPLAAGQEADNIKVTLGAEWGTVDTTSAGFGRIKLATGLHTVRFAVVLRGGKDEVRAISNPVEIEIVEATNTEFESAWGETKDGLRSRLVAETNLFQSGLPIRMRIEVQNVGDQARKFSYPTAPYFDVLQVSDAAGRRVAFLGGPLQLANQETNLNPGASAIFDAFDLGQAYFVRAAERYTVKWVEQFSAVPPSGEFQFELTAPRDTTESAELVSQLAPLLTGWLDDTPMDLAAVGTTHEAQAPGPLWPEAGHYRKSAGLRPGGNWTKVPGYGFVIHRDHYGERMANTNYDATVVWLWLTDTPATVQPVLRDGLPRSDYLGKIPRWHVYVSMDAAASNSWPTAKEDIKRALGGVESPGKTNAELQSGWGAAVDGISFGLVARKTVWPSGETPELVARVRNSGNHTFYTYYAWHAQLELDGVWYGNTSLFWGHLPPLRAGEERDELNVSLGTNDWLKANVVPPAAPQLAPGKHTIRYADDWTVGRDKLRAVSNPVEIEIAGAPGK